MNRDPVPRVHCPSCGKKMPWSTENKYRPFCSERCKLIDLGQWATERYRVAGESIRDEIEIPVTREN
ncbi:MAG: DNA gyrase inhibitor YacG [Hydrogenophilaceae bacterium]|jgi:hypothetical protein|nr:DNA gyrase inhibitor YacG [Hydrogenophilaceae bacterium]